MMFNNKPVLTPDDFDFSTVKIGDYVNQEVVDNAMDCLPPACYCASCAQMGEPYSHREDPKTGKFRPVFATFRKVGGEWPNSFGSIAATASAVKPKNAEKIPFMFNR